MKTGLIGCLTVCLMLGCASTQLPESGTVWVQAPTVLSGPSDSSELGLLVVKRDAGGGIGMRICNHRVSVDGRVLVELETGQGVKVSLRTGRHVVGLSFTTVLCDTGESAVTVSITRETPTVLRVYTSSDEKSQLMPSAN